MDNPSLDKKRKIKLSDGTVIVDLSLPTIDKKLIEQVSNMHFVAQEEAMRLDIIANKYYGWCDKLDAILWANNIYNPFSIEEGDWIIIPRVKDNIMYVVNPKISTYPGEDTQTISTKISSAADKLNDSGKKAKEERSKKKDMRRPNEQKPGTTHRQVDGAVLRLG